MSTLNSILHPHPHHISLSHPPYTFSSLLHQFQDRIDPYYEIDGRGSLSSLVSPLFNVCETETAYLLNGELPGVSDKSQINVEWLQNQTLFIRGVIPHEETERASEFPPGLKNDLAPLPVVDPLLEKRNEIDNHPHHQVHNGLSNIAPQSTQPPHLGPRHWLNERHLGPFERSFTFPSQIEPDGMKASLANGLLKIVVPKKVGQGNGGRRIHVV